MEAAMGGIGIAMPSPQMPTVGAGSSQREDSPARPTMRAHHAPVAIQLTATVAEGRL